MKKTDKKQPSNIKTEVVTLRLDPKTKFGLELLARKQYRTLSSVVEWAINNALQHEYEGFPELDDLWDVKEADRLVKLAVTRPNLLNYEEQLIWKVISEHGYFWKGAYKSNEWVWTCGVDSAIYDRIRDYFPLAVAIARDEKDKSELPSYEQTKESEFDKVPF
ncbi:MAG: hypothetical protein EXR08_12105 [Alphaproteobacteria bacterium]|nr:hypothetical protein [Alphaproteobacteria bacterium]